MRQVALLHLYASQIDLSPLTSSSSPHLKQVIISGAAKALTAPSLSHPFDLTAEVEELSQIIVPSAAKKKGSLSLRDYTSRDENGRAINNLPFVHTALDYDYLRDHFASISGLAISLPPEQVHPPVLMSKRYGSPSTSLTSAESSGEASRAWSISKASEASPPAIAGSITSTSVTSLRRI